MIGGTSAERNLLTVKLASCKYYDNLPTTGDETGRAFRDVELEKLVLEEAHKIGLGAQFGGKYFAHDVRIIRLPRHGASSRQFTYFLTRRDYLYVILSKNLSFWKENS